MTTTTTAAHPDKLAARRNYPTRYELAIVSPSGERFRLCYAARRGRASVRRLAADCAGRIAQRLGCKPGELLGNFTGKGNAAGLALSIYRRDDGDGWRVQFTGRTEREAYTLGELPAA